MIASCNTCCIIPFAAFGSSGTRPTIAGGMFFCFPWQDDDGHPYGVEPLGNIFLGRSSNCKPRGLGTLAVFDVSFHAAAQQRGQFHTHCCACKVASVVAGFHARCGRAWYGAPSDPEQGCFSAAYIDDGGERQPAIGACSSEKAPIQHAPGFGYCSAAYVFTERGSEAFPTPGRSRRPPPRHVGVPFGIENRPCLS